MNWRKALLSHSRERVSSRYLLVVKKTAGNDTGCVDNTVSLLSEDQTTACGMCAIVEQWPVTTACRASFQALGIGSAGAATHAQWLYIAAFNVTEFLAA